MQNSWTSNGWKREILPNGKYKFTIPLSNVDMIASTNQLLVKTGWAFEENDIVVVDGIKAIVMKVEGAWKYPNYSFILTVRCDRMDELKKLLTYEVESK